MRLNGITWTVALLALCALAWRMRDAPWPPQRIAGACLMLVGFGLVSLARYQLGKAFAVQAEARHLVTHGLYARLRNPIYVFAELFLLGLGLFLLSWWPVVLALMAIPVQVRRARREAEVLHQAFGPAYEVYRQQTWF